MKTIWFILCLFYVTDASRFQTKSKNKISSLRRRSNLDNNNPRQLKSKPNDPKSSSDHLPSIQAILIPRKISYPRIIRFIAAFIFTSSLLECLRTAGDPFRNSVISILEAHGVKDPMKGNFSALDVYIAKKIARANNDILPPQYIPEGIPCLGLFVSMFVINIGFTMLLPKWFVDWKVWLNYTQIQNHSRIKGKELLQEMKEYLHGNDKEKLDVYYQSHFINKDRLLGGNYNSTDTGLTVLVKIPPRDVQVSGNSMSTHQIVGLYRCDNSNECHPAPYYFNMGQRRFYVNIQVDDTVIHGKCLDGGPTFFREESISQLIQRGTIGLSRQSELHSAESRYGSYNDLSIPIPTVQDAFLARISSPLAILQLFGRFLSILEEDIGPTCMSMLNTFGQHYMSSRKGIVSAKELSKEIQGNVQDSCEELFWTIRPAQSINGSISKQNWIKVAASKLLPGDVFFLPSKDIMMPVDAMLLEGVCLSQEAAITGESVPQMKVPIEISGEEGEKLCMDSKHRKSILFAGTKVIKCEGSKKNDTLHLKGSSSAKCLVLKTGAYSSKGEIVRAITKNSSHIGRISTVDMDRDSLRLIFSLSLFSILACIYVCIPSKQKSTQTSGFRKIIQCTRILIASIPSDLPLALSGIMQSCVTQLKKESDVVCAEPGTLLSAAHIDLCVFDKTGTLTADTQVMSTVESPFNTNINTMAECVLAGCHSLSLLYDENDSGPQLIGDPLDRAALHFSRFNFNGTDQSASCRKYGKHSVELSAPIKLWQIKTFPFDASTRRSSALLLVQHRDDKMRLWKVCKGSPDSMRSLLSVNDSMTKDVMLQRYDEFYEALGSRGVRAISLASQDVSNTPLVSKLFPKGLVALQRTKSPKSLYKKIQKARIIAQDEFHMLHFEHGLASSMDFLGFGCFSASMRPSSPRVIKELRHSGTNVLMLTGDGVSAALNIARKANFFDTTCKVFATLDVKPDGSLCWTTIRGKNLTTKSRHEFNFQSTEKIILCTESSYYAMLITGSAMEALINSKQVEQGARNLMLCHLDQVSVIACASPETKQLVMANLKSYCKSYVLMCGDGLNDISAMKTADISVALLNGYGKENISSFDEENQRRISALKRKSDSSQGFNVQDRVKRKLEEALKNGSSTSSMTAVINVLKDEFRRSRALQKGGAEAARILREEALQQSLMNKATLNNDDMGDIEAIKPGEASLAASFTLLRPCIDGVDAIVRKGVVAAASSLSTFRSITLNSLMACYNLACLYKDGFRYGKYMWNIELAFILAMEKGQGDLSSASRPRIPRLRPQRSLFHPSIVLSVFLQAVIHIYVLTQGTSVAKVFQRNYETLSSGISLRCGASSLLSRYSKALTTINVEEGGSFWGRRPFHPNLVTNTVFILSIFQNAMISIFNHSGTPFVGTLLESKTFCVWTSASILFSILMLLEVQPSLNTAIQLAPMTSKALKLLLLSLMIFDVTACYVAENLTKRLLNEDLWNYNQRPAEIDQNSSLAADLEEEELLELRRRNANLVKSLVAVSSIYIMRTILKDDIFGLLAK